MKTKNFTAVIILFLIYVFELQAQIWEQTDGPFGGIIRCLAVHPSGTVYASMYQGGLYRSTDGGDSWFSVEFNGKEVDNIFVSTIGYIFITSHYTYIDEFGNIIWVTEPYRSTDNGENWNLVNVTLETTDCWAEDQYGNLFVDGYYSGGYKILKSTDGGENWVLWSNHGLASSNDFLFFDSYIFRSDDSNGIFQLINNSWVKRFPSQSGGLGTSCIERTSKGVLLAGTQIPGQGVYRSLDSAANWVRIYSAGIENTTVKSIIIDSDGIVFAATSNGIFKSIDEGATWVQNGLQNSWVWTIVLTSSNVLLAGNDFGMHRWNDTINGWEEVNFGLYVNRTYSLVVNQTTSSFFAATNTGLFRTTDNGEFWEFVLGANYGEEWYPGRLSKAALLFDVQSNSLFTVDLLRELYRSTDDGSTWITSSLPSSCDISCLVNGSEPGVIFGGGVSYPDWAYSTFCYSSNYGETWSQTYLGGPDGPPVQCLLLKESPSYLFAGTSGTGIYRSTDQGAFWRTFNVGLVNTNVQSIATNSAGDIFLGTYNGVFRSRDQGGNWTWIGLENDTVFALAINSIDYVLAGTKSGHIYSSTDDGDTWNDYSDGLGTTPIRSLLIDDNGFAMAGTVSKGVFRTIQSTVDVDKNVNELPTEFLLSQNYPNPFNPSTTFRYSIPYTSKVVIKVYDILGNEIATLMDEEKSVGTYELTWNAQNLPSGVYFYQLRAGTFIQTKKMLLLK